MSVGAFFRGGCFSEEEETADATATVARLFRGRGLVLSAAAWGGGRFNLLRGRCALMASRAALAADRVERRLRGGDDKEKEEDALVRTEAVAATATDSTAGTASIKGGTVVGAVAAKAVGPLQSSEDKRRRVALGEEFRRSISFFNKLFFNFNF